MHAKPTPTFGSSVIDAGLPSNKPLKLTAAGFSQSFGLGPKRFVVAFRAAAA
jgi:hypothetical protein